MRFRSRSPAETRAAGARLARALPESGGVVLLTGTLGAGKTVFAKGVAEGLGIDPGVLASPTFVIAQELTIGPGRRLVHADLYRVEDEDELEAAGWLDWLTTGSILLVEWGERIPSALPRERLAITISTPQAESPEDRDCSVEAVGAAAEAVLQRWAATQPGAER